MRMFLFGVTLMLLASSSGCQLPQLGGKPVNLTPESRSEPPTQPAVTPASAVLPFTPQPMPPKGSYGRDRLGPLQSPSGCGTGVGSSRRH